LAGFDDDFRFTSQKQICGAAKSEAAQIVTIQNPPQTEILMKYTRKNIMITLLSVATVVLPNLRGATFTVTEVADGLGLPNLRQALADANDGDTIEFDPLIGGRNLPLAPVFGELVVNKSVTIRWIPTFGNPSYLGVDAGHACRVFHISPGKTVTISGLGIVNGSAFNNIGGGIYNDHARLTLVGCTISGNSADRGTGGGIYNDGHDGTATMTIINSTISGNFAWPGGGIGNDGIMTITNSTVSGNSDNGYNYGGGVVNYATLTITNSTFSGNSAAVGGAIYSWSGSTLMINNTTFSDNFCNNPDWARGGGIYNEGGTLKIGNSILKAGPSGENIYHVDGIGGSLTSLGYNLSSDNGGGYLTATGDRINTDPRLGPLQNNGGPTFTHLPASDSPAIDGSDPAVAMDQRGAGFARVVNGRADIGAVEVQAIPTPTPTPTGTPRPHGRGPH
jgi:hypothetical protein